MKKKIITASLGLILSMIILSGCCLSHEWEPETCTAPKTCTKCGKTVGETLPHTWVEATCTVPKTCSVCNLEEGELAPHTWEEATCLQPRTCVNCGATDGDVLPHNWKEATCVLPKTCVACATTEGEPLGHVSEEFVVLKEASCTETGRIEGICSRCGEKFEQDSEMLEHSVGDWVVTKEATPGDKGIRVKSCIVCKAEIETEEFELTPEEKEAAYKKSCSVYKYSDIARNPGEYNGEKATFTGEVVQVQQQDFLGGLYYVLRVDVTPGWRDSDIIYVSYFAAKDENRILEDDKITMYGELTGEKTYTTVRGNSITIPSFTAIYIDIR